MRVLIIGGTGNISTAITQQLARRGADLTLFKRDTRLPEGVSGARVITGDRNDRPAMRRALQDCGTFDCVVDMICYEPEDAALDIEVFRGRARQFLFCSTVDVYTKTPASYPVTEENGVIGPLPSFPYAAKKAECERLMWEAHRRGDFAVTVIRPAATYSEARSPGVHSFGGQTWHLDRLRKGRPIILHGDGTSIWVAAHRDDVAVAFTNAVGNEAALGQSYNVTGDEWMTQNHIWRTLARVVGGPEPEFIYIPTDLLARLDPEQAEWCLENFRHNNIFDNAKAKRDLGFRYTIPFEEGARRCWAYLSANGLVENCDDHPFYDRLIAVWRRHTAALQQDYRR